MSITEIGGLLVFDDSYAVEITVPRDSGHPVYWSDDSKLNLRIRNKDGWVEMQLTEAQAEILADFIRDLSPSGTDLADFGEHLFLRSGALESANGVRRVKYDEAMIARRAAQALEEEEGA